jgi:hypothetical protein
MPRQHNKPVLKSFTIGLGRCGPTDCCITLTHKEHFMGGLQSIESTKQYGIESIAWRLLGVLPGGFTISNDSGNEALYQIIQTIWDLMDDDIIE